MAIQPPPSLNGRPRKQLSDQLDRMDDILVGLEEHLPQAVADAARDGIRQAFRDVLSEFVADPALLDKLRANVGSEIATPKPSAWARLKAAVRGAAVNVVNAVKIIKRKVTNGVTNSCAAAKSRVARWSLLSLPVLPILSVSLAVGLVIAFVSLAAPHVLAAAISGLGAAFTTACLQVGRWFRRQKAKLALI